MEARLDSTTVSIQSCTIYGCFRADNGAGLGASHQMDTAGPLGRLFQVYGAHVDLEAVAAVGGVDKSRPAAIEAANPE